MDTIGLILKKEQVPSINFMEEIPPHLDILSNEGIPIISKFGVPTIHGRCRNMQVSISANSFYIGKGSLQKFATGNNVSPIGRRGVINAIEEIQDILHLPLMKASVKSFDFAKNIITKYEPKIYFPYLGNMQYHTRLVQPTTINYKNATREFCTYDKIKELKSHREVVPPLYANLNLLRMEWKLQRDILKYFNLPLLTPQSLTDEDFYVRLCNDFYKTYLSIDKLKKYKIDMKNITTKEQLKKMGVLSIIQMQGGKLEALESINERLQMKELTRKQASDLRLLINECSKLVIATEPSELILELDQKVKESIHNYR